MDPFSHGQNQPQIQATQMSFAITLPKLYGLLKTENK